MSRLSLFNSPLLLGFEHFEEMLDRIAKSGEGYPPYNVEQLSEQRLAITLAVAGFRSEDLEVQLEDNQLVIRGRQSEEDKERVYLHRGIAARQFQRSFVLAEGIEVVGAALDNGLLRITLERPANQPQVRRIAIERAPATKAPTIEGKLGEGKLDGPQRAADGARAR
ncbi:MAG: Hsp20 family protein [Kiloniellales bacterium]